MNKLERVSFGEDELRAIKRAVTNDRPYADRISLSFAARLVLIKEKLREDHIILNEIDYLEGLCPQTATKLKDGQQFKHAPLHPFWHKHYSAPRHILQNIVIHWNLSGKGKPDPLTPMLRDVAKDHGDQPDRWPGVAAYKMFVDGFKDRAHGDEGRPGLTGDWIIFGKHAGQNYYLDLATHEEGEIENAKALREKLRQGSAIEFPFLFEH